MKDSEIVLKLKNAMKALDGVIHHNENTKQEFQLPESLIKQIKKVLK